MALTPDEQRRYGAERLNTLLNHVMLHTPIGTTIDVEIEDDAVDKLLRFWMETPERKVSVYRDLSCLDFVGEALEKQAEGIAQDLRKLWAQRQQRKKR